MAGRDARVLQAELNRLTAGLQTGREASAGEPLQSELDCFPQIKDNACVLTEISVVESPTDFVCTNRQADELEAIWNRKMAPQPSSSSRADAALLARLHEMRKALRQSLPQKACDNL